MKSSSVKRNAKQILKDNWTAAMAITAVRLMVILLSILLPSYLIILIASQVPEELLGAAESLLLLALIFMLYFPIRTGKCGWYYSISDGERSPMSEAFKFFSGRNFGRGVLYGVLYFLKMLGWMFVAVIPFSVLVFFGEEYEELSLLIEAADVLTSIAFVAIVIINMLRYFLVPYILAANENVTVGQAFKLSCRLMKGNKNAVVGLFFSFTLWFVSCIVVLPFIYVKPYFDASKAVLARKIMETQPEKVSGEFPKQYTGGIPEEVIA